MPAAAGPRFTVRAVVIGLTLLGMVAMHGLPDAMTGSSPQSAAAMPGMSVHLSGGTARTPGVELSASMAAEPSRCAMDHGNCVAVLRYATHLATVAPTRAVTLADVLRPEPVLLGARGARSPPDIELLALGISRT